MQRKATALDKALRSLALRSRSEKEIVEKLTRDGFTEREIAEAMAKLSEYSLIDDGAFADQWASHRSKRGLGPRRIAMELRQKGIGREQADRAIASLDEDAVQAAADALAERHLAKGGDNARRRTMDALFRRGFSYDTAKRAIQNAEANLQRENE